MNDFIKILTELTAYGFFIIYDDQVDTDSTYQAYKNRTGEYVIVRNVTTASITTTGYFCSKNESTFATNWTNRATLGYADRVIF